MLIDTGLDEHCWKDCGTYHSPISLLDPLIRIGFIVCPTIAKFAMEREAFQAMRTEWMDLSFVITVTPT